MPPRHYHLHHLLGEGSFGKVYRAETTGSGSLPRQVALKMLHTGLPNGDEVAARLRDEARMLALIRHRAIVQVDSLIRVEGRWCAVMEYIHGADLRAVLSHAGPMPPSAALELIAELAGALHAAYTTVTGDGPLRLIHRDIKPGNIQLTAAGEVKLLDFGVARAEFGTREAQTRSLAFGTVDYMAPERMMFETTPGGDVYGLGIVLAEVLLGYRSGHTVPDPYKHKARVAELALRVSTTTRSPALAEFVGQLLLYNPTERPDAREVQREAQRLAKSAQGEALRDWAERHVDEARAAQPPATDELCGKTIEERGRDADGTEQYAFVGSPSPPPADAPTGKRPSAGLRWAVLAAGIASLLALGCAGLWLAWRPAPEVVKIDAPAPVEEIAPPTPEPAPKPLPPPKKKTAAPRPDTPATAPTPTGAISVSGDAQDIVFVGDAGSFPPGSLPAGKYKIQGRFGDGPPRGLGAVDVPADTTVKLSCAEAFGRCTKEP